MWEAIANKVSTRTASRRSRVNRGEMAPRAASIDTESRTCKSEKGPDAHAKQGKGDRTRRPPFSEPYVKNRFTLLNYSDSSKPYLAQIS